MGTSLPTVDDGEGVQLAIRSGAKRCWRTGPGDGDKLLSTWTTVHRDRRRGRTRCFRYMFGGG